MSEPTKPIPANSLLLQTGTVIKNDVSDAKFSIDKDGKYNVSLGLNPSSVKYHDAAPGAEIPDNHFVLSANPNPDLQVSNSQVHFVGTDSGNVGVHLYFELSGNDADKKKSGC